MIDVARTLPIISVATSPDETAPLKAFSEENALVARSFNEAYTISYVVEEPGALVYVRWRDVEGDIDKLHDIALANLRVRANAKLRLAPRDGFVDVVLDGKFDASLLLLDELWDGSGIVARAVTSPIVAAIPSSETLLVASASSKEGLRHLGAQHVPMLLVRRTGTWDQFAGFSAT
jgi:hypothetical protein